VWAKPNPMPESCRDRPTSSYEMVFLLTKAARYWYDADAVREVAAVGHNASDFHTGKAGVNQHRCSSAPRVDTGNRNLRNVWTIPTQPFPEAHFATFPRKLVEPCVRAGCPKKVCAVCGAGWVRVVESKTIPLQKTYNGAVKTVPMTPAGVRWGGKGVQSRLENKTLGWRPTCECSGDTKRGIVLDPFAGSRRAGRPLLKQPPLERLYAEAVSCREFFGEVSYSLIDRILKEVEHMKGLVPPVCGCNSETKCGVVLDPFAGSGTAGIVALTEGRDFIGFDLNPDYCKMANERLSAVMDGVPVKERRAGQGSLL